MARKTTNFSKPVSSKKSTKKPLRTAKVASKIAANRQIFLVLGMHRSGTSALSGLLHYAGCSVPKTLMAATERNPKGYFESEPVSKFNDALLKKAGSSWKSLHAVPPDLLEAADGGQLPGQAEELLSAQFGKASMMVLKDPRICRMVPFWRAAAEACGFEVCPVLIHRNPLEVAKSLFERDGIDTTEGLMIWLQHVLLAEYETRKMNRFVTSYSQILTDWNAQVEGVQTRFGITFPKFGKPATAKKINAFLSPGLRHFQEAPERVTDSEEVSQWVSTTYKILEKWAQEGETKSSHAALDQVRREMNRALPVLSQIIDARTRTLSKDLNYRTAQVRTAHSRHRDYLEEIATLRSSLNQYVMENERLDKTREKHTSIIAGLQEEIDDISQVLANRQEQIGKSHATQAEQRSRIMKLKVELEDGLQSQNLQIIKLEDEKANAKASLSAQIKQKEADVARLSGMLDERTEQTERLLLDLSDRQSQLQTSNEKIRSLDEEKSGLLEDLKDINIRYEALQNVSDRNDRIRADAEVKMRAMQSQIVSIRSSLVAREREVKDAVGRAAAAEQAHTDAEANTERLSFVLATQQAQLQANEKKLYMQAAEKAVFLAEVGDISARCDELQAICDQKDRTFAVTEADLKSLRDQLATTRSALAQRQLEAEETFERATVAERAHTVAQNALSKAEDARKAADERATVAERAHTVAQNALSKAQDAHKAAEAENQKNRVLALEQERRIESLQTRLDGMHNSRIWRMTKPLRRAVDVLRGHR
tara:strand:+ start:7580 stop:9880 length:2301 start_codon:yes stop_codon:yes gene_type:complete